MSANRDDLHQAINRLTASLAKAERQLPLSQPIRSWDLYAHAIQHLDTLTDNVRTTITRAREPQ